ncbi:hypothetical protein Mal4_28450 [Maioricimonas rarisocia]|uniref:Uncharacterized protein n=1 Tax=Maioricimonas rarisocia TaxID=2528026 RepID=A0A517Z7R3_9PLAN|nr:AAA family ATPase [Maioricimonas rarisocia]QDU38516.1 hypothetical protein Mal4_28450 [Maioricimonas rarisocia]
MPKNPAVGLKLGRQWLATREGTCRHCGLPRFAHAGEHRVRCPRDEEELLAVDSTLGSLLDEWRAIVQPVNDFHEYLQREGRRALKRSEEIPPGLDSRPLQQEMLGEIRCFREHMIEVADRLAERELDRRKRKGRAARPQPQGRPLSDGNLNHAAVPVPARSAGEGICTLTSRDREGAEGASTDTPVCHGLCRCPLPATSAVSRLSCSTLPSLLSAPQALTIDAGAGSCTMAESVGHAGLLILSGTSSVAAPPRQPESDLATFLRARRLGRSGLNHQERTPTGPDDRVQVQRVRTSPGGEGLRRRAASELSAVQSPADRSGCRTTSPASLPQRYGEHAPMKLACAQIRNFRRLEDVSIIFDESETVFVGPNNSGKTSAADVFRHFVKSREFSIHDFSVSQLDSFNQFARGELDESDLPAIELDLWFAITPQTQFGRVGMLLPDVEQDYNKVGIRLRFCVNDPEELKESYESRCAPGRGAPTKELTEYLEEADAVRRHFSISYSALSGDTEPPHVHPLSPEQGRRLVAQLVRVEFVDAQRNIDDHERTGTTRLSNVFDRYYKRYLDQATTAHEATDLVVQHNVDLTLHYERVFKELLDVIGSLGVPSAADRSPKLVSNLVPESVLGGNAVLTYVDQKREHSLPEKYCGLGVKNLIYLAVTICDLHLDWINTSANRPLLLILFVEEPEVHLHAQAQQTFITNVRKILQKNAREHDGRAEAPQIVVTTHSSHILDAVEFPLVRYFRRCRSRDESATTTTLSASTVLDLGQFSPEGASIVENATVAGTTTPGGDENGTRRATSAVRQDTLRFLRRYMRLTHCDLFFADAAILVEGTVEKLLMPEMIARCAPLLQDRYITVLEVGGAFAHRFEELLRFLAIPFLVITDVDSVKATGRRTACRADAVGAKTSNAALRHYLRTDYVSDLNNRTIDERTIAEGAGCVVYQRPTPVNAGGESEAMHGRTFEEAFVYENLRHYRDGDVEFPGVVMFNGNLGRIHQRVFDAVKSQNFKKAEFALSVLASEADWRTPEYISEGLEWLQDKLRGRSGVASEENGR